MERDLWEPVFGFVCFSAHLLENYLEIRTLSGKGVSGEVMLSDQADRDEI